MRVRLVCEVELEEEDLATESPMEAIENGLMFGFFQGEIISWEEV